MLALVLIGLCGLAILVAGFSYGRVKELSERMDALAREVREIKTTRSLPPPTVPEAGRLQGVRIVLEVEQSHPTRPFETLLREALHREDALLVSEGGEVRIAGRLVDNGYADVYFEAELTVSSGTDVLFSLRERPPHGDRPGNLALETVERLRTEWTKRQARGERQDALRELTEG